jgi:hypothetical protein
MFLYQQSDFSFSTKAKKWILGWYRGRFESTFSHDLDPNPLSPDATLAWNSSPVYRELNSFLSKYKLDTNWCGITALVSNLKVPFNNPHIDFIPVPKNFVGKINSTGTFKVAGVKSRFNVFVFGDPGDEMVWWPDWASDDSRLQQTKFIDADGKYFSMPGIPGDTPEARWAALGNPAVKVKNLYDPNPSAFVRADCAHAVNVSPGPRLLITVGLNASLEEIFGPRR